MQKQRLLSNEKYVDGLFSKIEAPQVIRKRFAKSLRFSIFLSAFIGYIGTLLGVYIKQVLLRMRRYV